MEEPWIEIIEQPKRVDHRFRYKCEGNGAGSILGEFSTNSTKTSPTIKIHNMSLKERAVVVVSCVTRSDPFQPHPHSLVGHGCNKGVCLIQVKGSSTVKLGNVGIQCCRHQDARQALELRKEIHVDPFQTGHDVDLRQMDLSAVRLCFQVFLPGPDQKFSRVVKPVVTQEIVDRRTENRLEICRLSRQSAFCRGGEELIILCDKAKKGDVQVRFFGDLPDGSDWEAYGGSTDVHRQYAVVCTTPRYPGQLLSGPASVWVQLFRPSDQMTGEPKPFQFIPSAPDVQSILSAKRRKIEQRGFSISNGSTGSVENFEFQEPFLLSSSQHPAVPGNGLDLMSVVGAATPPGACLKLPPPYPGLADVVDDSSGEVDRDAMLNDLVDWSLNSVVTSGQPHVNLVNCSSDVESNAFVSFAPTGQQCANVSLLRSTSDVGLANAVVYFAPTGQRQANVSLHRTTCETDFETVNYDVSINVPTLIREEPHQGNRRSTEVNISGSNLIGQFINYALTGQRHGNNQRANTSGRTVIGTDNPQLNSHQADQAQMNNVRRLTSDAPVTGLGCQPVNDVGTRQPGFNPTETQEMFHRNQTTYIFNSTAGKLWNIDEPSPAGTLLQVTQAPVEDDIPRDNY